MMNKNILTGSEARQLLSTAILINVTPLLNMVDIIIIKNIVFSFRFMLAKRKSRTKKTIIDDIFKFLKKNNIIQTDSNFSKADRQNLFSLLIPFKIGSHAVILFHCPSGKRIKLIKKEKITSTGLFSLHGSFFRKTQKHFQFNKSISKSKNNTIRRRLFQSPPQTSFCHASNKKTSGVTLFTENMKPLSPALDLRYLLLRKIP